MHGDALEVDDVAEGHGHRVAGQVVGDDEAAARALELGEHGPLVPRVGTEDLTLEVDDGRDVRAGGEPDHGVPSTRLRAALTTASGRRR